jgi:hypothetical protein
MMNILLWILQVLAALLYGSSGVMKVFMVEKISRDAPSFGLVFVWVHVQYHEMTPLVLSAVLGLLMAFVAYGRSVLSPIV